MNLPEFKSIPVDKDMAIRILEAISIADHESMGFGGEATRRIVSVLFAAYPDLVETYAHLGN